MQTFTEILNIFINVLEKIPQNLKIMAYSLLFFLSTIEIALTIYNNIDNESFSYIKWGKIKILKIGFIMFAINRYEWILNGVKSFFMEIGSKGLGLSLKGSNYFNKPSEIYDLGIDIANHVRKAVSWKPSTYVFLILAILIAIGFFLIAIQVIICWVEFYFLTGISIVFLPFGALDITVEYYKNVFKTIMGASIKLCVFNIWVLICEKILKSLADVPKEKITFDYSLIVAGTAYILVTVLLSMPSMTTSLLTGTPTLNAGAAMSAATGAVAGLGAGMAHMYRGTKETVKGAYEGAKTGGSLGKTVGGIVGGPVGGAVIGTLGGAIGGAVKGTYAAGRYAIFKEKGKDKTNEEKPSSNRKSSNQSLAEKLAGNTDSPDNNSSSINENKSTNSKTDTINTGNNRQSQQTNNSSNTIGSTENNINTSSTNTESATKPTMNGGEIPNWAKDDY
ncbi:MAG: type IV secretion system protein [Fusobacterium sp.]|uniref:type IV secretion system protein n=1 Tax=Fusobacterium sp. TaxID=68766 RepID=UPI0026DBFDB2|nr:type IV secretion system protein [Fusobacterium sp.]MDO4689814.1 type IV secretion system protein [Fusobacterium sp.]